MWSAPIASVIDAKEHFTTSASFSDAIFGAKIYKSFVDFCFQEYLTIFHFSLFIIQKIYKWKIVRYFWKAKIYKTVVDFCFQKIASEIDAEVVKCSFSSITYAIEADYWTHNKLTSTMNVNSGKD